MKMEINLNKHISLFVISAAATAAKTVEVHTFSFDRHQFVCGNGACTLFVHMYHLYTWPLGCKK